MSYSTAEKTLDNISEQLLARVILAIEAYASKRNEVDSVKLAKHLLAKKDIGNEWKAASAPEQSSTLGILIRRVLKPSVWSVREVPSQRHGGHPHKLYVRKHPIEFAN